MLALTRKPKQAIVLDLPNGDRITVTVVEIDGSNRQVRLAVDAPAEVRVLRDELLRRKPKGD